MAVIDNIGNTANAQGDEEFDVFLSHSHTEAEAVEVIGSKLIDEAGLRVWFDRWILIAGNNWQPEMVKGLQHSKTCAVFVGRKTPCGWVREEMERALNRQTKESGFRVIPVILPNGDRRLIAEFFLELRTWVEFKNGLADDDAFYRLVCGVRGTPPGRRIKAEPLQSDALALLKTKLSEIRDLCRENLIFKEVALEHQRKLLDQYVKAEKWK